MNKQKWWPHCVLALIAFGFGAGCSSDSGSVAGPSGVTPFAIEAVTQIVLVGVVEEVVAPPPRVRVKDKSGKPIRGADVTFEVDGGGTIAHHGAATDLNGEASVASWRLGTKSGIQKVTARVSELTPVEFTAMAKPGPVTQISHDGDEQAARPASALSKPLSIRIADKYNNPVPGLTATFTVLSGEGSVERGTATTGSDGIATSGIWMLGPVSGPQHVKARVATNSNRWEVVFTAHACERLGMSGCEPPLPPSCSSPTDCGEIVFVSSRDGQAEIYSVNRDGTGLTRLTNNPATDWDPAWSPDGKRIAFISDRSSYPELYVMNADGSNVVRRTFWANSSESPAWSPDGTLIAFAAGSSDGMTIWSISADENGKGPTRMPGAPGHATQPAWSPDGNVWFTALVGDDELEIRSLTQTAPFGAIWGDLSIHYPAWSRDGSKMTVAFYTTSGAQLGVLDRTGSTLRPLATTGLFTKSSWSPDGKIIAFSSGTPSARNLMWINEDGSGPGTIVTNGWAPDWKR